MQEKDLTTNTKQEELSLLQTMLSTIKEKYDKMFEERNIMITMGEDMRDMSQKMAVREREYNE